MQEPRKYLIELGLSDSEITVYLSMIQGIQVASEIVKTTQLKRPTVYYALGCLEKRGLISKTGLEGDKKYFVEPVEKLITLVNEKSNEIATLKNNIEKLIPFLTQTTKAHDTKPTVTFHEGVEAVKSIIMEMLYAKKKHIDSIIPHENFFWQLGLPFVERFVNERIRKNIVTNNIWEKEIASDTFKKYYKVLGHVRIMPKVMCDRFQTSIFMYDNKTLYVSSKKNSYAILICSEEHTETMKALFDGIWCGSKPHTNQE